MSRHPSPLTLAAALVVAAALVAPGSALAATTRYVSASAASDPACAAASQANPFATIQGALACAPNGATVRIGAGTFPGQFTITRNVTLVGAGPTTVITGATSFANTAPAISIAAGHTVTIKSLTEDGVGRISPGIVAQNGSLTVANVTVERNHSGVAGAGISAVGTATAPAYVTVQGSTVADNQSDSRGGGIWVSGGVSASPSKLTVVNSTITGNSSLLGPGGGGGIAVGTAALSVRDSTVARNDANYGGGLYALGDPQPVSLTNTIVASNTAAIDDADCVVPTTRPVVDGGHNLVGQSSGCTGFVDGLNGDQVGTVATPIDPVLGPLASNGGATQTLALLAGSPAIGAGDPADCQRSPVSNADQRGRTRNAAVRLSCDTGAYDTGTTPVQMLYVSHAATADPSCAAASQANPFATLAGALACASNGATIKLGSGTFAGQVAIDRNVVLQGAGASTVIRGSTSLSHLAPAISVADGRLVTLSSLTIDGVDEYSAGVAAGSGSLILANATVKRNGNHASDGGAISVRPTSAGQAHVTLYDTTIDDNFTDYSGAGIFVTGNSAAPGPSELTVVDSTITANTAGPNGASHGGGIRLAYASLSVRDSTIAGNSALDGGGLYADSNSGRVTLTNALVAGNTAENASGPDCLAAAVTDGGHNLVGTGCAGLADGVNGDHVGTAAAPIDPLLGPLANHGGQTMTQALLAGSPAIGAGDATDCRAWPVAGKDQRGKSRNAGTRAACDIGAYDTGGL